VANNTTAGLISSENLAVANTAIEDAASRLFAMGVPGQYQQFTTVRSVTGTSAELNVVDGIPQVREWLGSRTLKQLRAYRVNKPLRAWEMTLRVPVDAINAGGAVSQVLSGFAARAATFYDKIMTTHAFLANPTCYDGQALLSASHPVASGTVDNLEAAALTAALFHTAWESIVNRTDYEGEPLDLTPSHLMVGPALSNEAMLITGSEVPYGITDGGEIVQPGGSSVDANAVLMTNYRGGSVDVIVNKRLTGNQWALMDLTKGDIKPFYGFQFVAPTVVIKDNEDDDNVFFNDEVLYGIHSKYTPLAGMWQLIHGSVTT